MRCIEITIYDPYDLECSLININMRCIEMIYSEAMHSDIFKININMRCIEIARRNVF